MLMDGKKGEVEKNCDEKKMKKKRSLAEAKRYSKNQSCYSQKKKKKRKKEKGQFGRDANLHFLFFFNIKDNVGFKFGGRDSCFVSYCYYFFFMFPILFLQ